MRRLEPRQSHWYVLVALALMVVLGAAHAQHPPANESDGQTWAAGENLAGAVRIDRNIVKAQIGRWLESNPHAEKLYVHGQPASVDGPVLGWEGEGGLMECESKGIRTRCQQGQEKLALTWQGTDVRAWAVESVLGIAMDELESKGEAQYAQLEYTLQGAVVTDTEQYELTVILDEAMIIIWGHEQGRAELLRLE